MAQADLASMTINPDNFLEADEGRVWTYERNAEAWSRSYQALEQAIRDTGGAARVILVCGLQGAGKTTWITSQPASLAVIYFDAALPGVRHRAPIVSIAMRLCASIDAVWIRTPLRTALERNAQRASDKIVPVAAIHSVANQFEEPTTAEGFDRIVIIDGGSMSA